jgi:hypothetical protein
MHKPAMETVPSLLMKNIPREMLMSIEEALLVGAARAYDASRGMDQGHRPSVLGQLRHFHMNESFHRSLDVAQGSPSPIRGNQIVTGRAGVFTLARFNIKEGFWINGRRSQTRKQMSLANAAIEPLVQHELFEKYTAPADAVAFFVACFSGSLTFRPEAPLSIQIAVPDRHMSGWLFKEPLAKFLQRYDAKPTSAQEDLAIPTLKKSISKRVTQGSTP